MKEPTAGQSQLVGEAEDSPIRGTPGRVRAVLTTTGRPGTTRQVGPGKRHGKVYERNRRLKPRKRCASSNLVDVGWSVARDLRDRQCRVNSEAGQLHRWGGQRESLRRTSGDATGAESSTSSVNRCAVNVGTIRGRPIAREAIPGRGRSVVD
jgi:hypothetical protein